MGLPYMSLELDNYEQQLLDIIQSSFPLAQHPYKILGERVGLSEEDAFACVEQLSAKGLIRRIGANFQSAKLGFVSTLCAAKVPEDQVEKFSCLINACPGVTHNYVRAHAYNVWFTLIAPSWNDVCKTLATFSEHTGIDILNLPATRLYKIRVDFRMKEST